MPSSISTNPSNAPLVRGIRMRSLPCVGMGLCYPPLGATSRRLDAMRTSAAQPVQSALDPGARERLVRYAEAAVRRARRDGEALAAVTVTLDGAADPTAIVAAS